MSLNFGGGGGGSKSNISSIVHMEEVSQGYYSIDKQEYRLQQKAKKPKQVNAAARLHNNHNGIKVLSSRSLKDEPLTTENYIGGR